MRSAFSSRRIAKLRSLACCAGLMLAAVFLAGERAGAQPSQVLGERVENDTSGETPASPPDADAASTNAQEAPATDAPADAEPSQGPKPAGPDTTIWIDDEGTPRPVFGVSQEELLRAWRLLEGLESGDETPRFTRDLFEATGRVKGDRVRLAVRYELTLRTQQRVAAPLGLAGGVLASKPKVDGAEAGKQFVSYEAERGGFVAWLQGKPGDRRTIEVDLLLPLRSDGLQTLLRMNVPRAGRSSLNLEGPTPFNTPFASEGAMVDVQAFEGGDKAAGERLVVTGLVGNFQLGWRRATAEAAPKRATLAVEGQVFCEVDGRTLRHRAALNIKSYGGPLERFRVRLPIGASLTPAGDEADAAAPRISPLPAEVDATGELRPMCLVTLPEETSEPVTVVIEAEQTVGVGTQAIRDLAGFEVVGAVRQDGELAVRVADDWRLRWREVKSAQRIDLSSLSGDLQRPGVTAAFKYFGQPWKLEAQVIRLGNRVEASPRYRLEIQRETAILTTRIDYKIPGARITSVKVDLRDFTESLSFRSPSGSPNLVNPIQSRQGQDGELFVSFTRPTGQRESIEFTTRRDLKTTDELLEFRLPVAKADSSGASELIVVVAPGVQLTPDLEKTRRLQPAPLPEGQRDGADPSGIRTFRFVGFLPDPVFAAEKRLRPGELDVAVRSTVDLTESMASVEQRFDFDARYEAVTNVTLAAPVELVDRAAIEFELIPTGQSSGDSGASAPVPAGPGTLLSYRQGSPPEADDRRMGIIVNLPQPWVGPFRIRARFVQEGGLRELKFAKQTGVELISPVETLIRDHRLTISAESGEPLALAAEQPSWAPEGQATVTGGELSLQATAPATAVAVTEARGEVSATGGAVLSRVWRQTWVSPTAIQQRAAFRFTSTEREAKVELPAGLANEPVEVTLDGSPAAIARTGAVISVALPADGPAEHTLEVRYIEPPTADGRVPWNPTRLVASGVFADGYWEVVLPAGRRLVGSPEGFATAMTWEYQPGSFTRRPTRDTEELEAWAGAETRQQPMTTQQRHLFSYFENFGKSSPNSLQTISQTGAVIGCSAVVLGVGLALIYLPWLRTAPVLFALVVVLVSSGFVWPTEFLVVAQTGLLGLLLAGLAFVLAAVLKRPSVGEVAVASSSLVVPPSGPGTDTLIALPMGAVSTNAPTTSMPPADSTGTSL